MMQTPCPACGAVVHARQAWSHCRECGLRTRSGLKGPCRDRLDGSRDPLAVLAQVRDEGGSLGVSLPNGDCPLVRPAPDVQHLFTPRSLLHLAQRAGLFSEGIALSGWRSRLPWIRVRLNAHRPAMPPVKVGLIVLCCSEDQAEAAELVGRHAGRFAETTVMVDADEPPAELARLAGPAVRIVPRRLADDFSAQRNAAVRQVRSRWVLHLDADEQPGEGLLDQLPLWIDLARRHGLRVLGIPRQNWVDGDLSDVYPDYQFRLHRSDQRWTRPVHEVPSACVRRWRQVWRLPADGQALIVHRLTRQRLAEKAGFYDSIAAGMGQTDGIRRILRATGGRNDD